MGILFVTDHKNKSDFLIVHKGGTQKRSQADERMRIHVVDYRPCLEKESVP